MKWGGLTTVFLLATIKFMVAPLPGQRLHLSFLETYLASCAGGIVGAAIFYFAAEFFLKWSHDKKVAKQEAALAQGITLPVKKKFTKLNKFIVRIKMKLGFIGICFWAPFFMSIPIGAIVVAKFYGKRKMTFPLICIGMGINALATTAFAYIF